MNNKNISNVLSYPDKFFVKSCEKSIHANESFSFQILGGLRRKIARKIYGSLSDDNEVAMNLKNGLNDHSSYKTNAWYIICMFVMPRLLYIHTYALSQGFLVFIDSDNHILRYETKELKGTEN
jgi:hypothetical protein